MNGEYEVGYRKPPKATQFRKGQSGNAAGRPRGTKNLRTDLKEELAERITVREGNRTRTITKQRGIVMALVTGAIKGNARSIVPLLALIAREIDDNEGMNQGQDDLTNDEKEVLAALGRRVFGDSEAGPEARSQGAGKEEKSEEDR